MTKEDHPLENRIMAIEREIEQIHDWAETIVEAVKGLGEAVIILNEDKED